MNLTEKFFNFAFLFLFFFFFFRFYYDVIGNKEIVYGRNGIYSVPVCIVKRVTRGACSSCSLSVVWYIEVWSIQNVQNRDGGSFSCPLYNILIYWYIPRKYVYIGNWYGERIETKTKPTTQATSRPIVYAEYVFLYRLLYVGYVPTYVDIDSCTCFMHSAYT